MEAHTVNYSRICAILRQARHERGLTQLEFSRRLGKSYNFVSMYESGERRLDIVEFNSIARELRIDAANTLRKITPVPGAKRRAPRRKAASEATPLAKQRSSKLKADRDRLCLFCRAHASIDD